MQTFSPTVRSNQRTGANVVQPSGRPIPKSTSTSASRSDHCHCDRVPRSRIPSPERVYVLPGPIARSSVSSWICTGAFNERSKVHHTTRNRSSAALICCSSEHARKLLVTHLLWRVAEHPLSLLGLCRYSTSAHRSTYGTVISVALGFHVGVHGRSSCSYGSIQHFARSFILAQRLRGRCVSGSARNDGGRDN